jgi:hypothetical protein
MPWYAKALVVAIAAHALSPIDLLFDFILYSAISTTCIAPIGIAAVG